MTRERIVEIARAMAEIGVDHVKITGGEPLLRTDIVQIVRGIAQIGKFKDISLTTNGILLERFAAALKKAGLMRLNIGSDSLSSNIVPKHMDRILPGIIAAKNAKLSPIKLNMVALKGINSNEIWDMIEFAKTHNVVLQLIELIPNDSVDFKRFYFPLTDIEKDLRKKADKIVARELQGRTQFHLDGAVVEIVEPSHKSFCANCGKIRVTSDGKIKPCLMRNDNLVNFDGADAIPRAIAERSPYYDKDG